MAGKFSDEELLKQNLVLSDALDQPNVIHHIPEGVALLSIINVYRHKAYPKTKVRCAHCGRTNHRDGFTALLASMNRVLLGSTCGAEAYGASWNEAMVIMEGKRDRQYELKMLGRAGQVLKPFIRAVNSWAWKIDKFDARRRTFETSYGAVHAKLFGAMRVSDGVLSIDVRVRDYAAETMKPNDGEKWKMETRPMGRLAGGGFLERDAFTPTIDAALKAAEKYRAIIGKSEGIPTDRMARLRRDFERKAEALRHVYEVYDGRDDFFSPRNLDLVIAWLNEVGHRNAFTRDGNTLVGMRIRFGMEDMADLNPEPLDLLEEFKRGS